jgi:hypothetical protein
MQGSPRRLPVSRSHSYADFETQLQGYARSAAAAIRRSESTNSSAYRGWLAFTSASAAVVMPSFCEAGLIYSGPKNLPLSLSSSSITSGSYYQFFGELHLDTDSINDVRLRGFLDSFSYFAVRLEGLNGAKIARGAELNAAALRSGESIGASQSFRPQAYLLAGGYTDSSGSWNRSGSDTFAGVQLGDRFGWIRIEVFPFTAFDQAIVRDWAYEDAPGESIAAGAIPEPDTDVLTRCRAPIGA